MNKKQARKFFGYAENEEQAKLERLLSELAAQWRKTKQEEIVQKYTQTLEHLMSLGWNDYLDIEAELPDELMPKAYLERKRSLPVR